MNPSVGAGGHPAPAQWARLRLPLHTCPGFLPPRLQGGGLVSLSAGSSEQSVNGRVLGCELIFLPGESPTRRTVFSILVTSTPPRSRDLGCFSFVRKEKKQPLFQAQMTVPTW